ncbi:MAG: hypothetical protein V1754_15650, partial [Pseudomonadota bacterium]
MMVGFHCFGLKRFISSGFLLAVFATVGLGCLNKNSVTIEGNVLGLAGTGDTSWSEAEVVVATLFGEGVPATAVADSAGHFKIALSPAPEDGTILVVSALHPSAPADRIPLFTLVEVHSHKVAKAFPGVVNAANTEGLVTLNQSEANLSGVTTAATLLHIVAGMKKAIDIPYADFEPMLVGLPLDDEVLFAESVSDILATFANQLPPVASIASATTIASKTAGLNPTLFDRLREETEYCASKVHAANQLSFANVYWAYYYNVRLEALRQAIDGIMNQYWTRYGSRLPICHYGIARIAELIQEEGVGNCNEHAYFCAYRVSLLAPLVKQVVVAKAKSPRKEDGHAYVLLSDLTESELDLEKVTSMKVGPDGCLDEKNGEYRIGLRRATIPVDKLCLDPLDPDPIKAAELEKSIYFVDSWQFQKVGSSANTSGQYQADYPANWDLAGILDSRRVEMPTA